MKNNILLSIFVGIIVYSITILVSIFLGLPLSRVLYNGVLGLLIFGCGTFLLTIYLDKFDESDSNLDKFNDGENEKQEAVQPNNEDYNENEDDNENVVEDQQEDEDNDEEFSPMDPTVLEVEEESN